jgi:hypothetical protein
MNQDTKERRRSADLELAALRKCVEDMKELDDELHTEVKELLRAWDTATGLVVFIKWLAGLAAALGVIWVFLNGMPKQ